MGHYFLDTQYNLFRQNLSHFKANIMLPCSFQTLTDPSVPPDRIYPWASWKAIR